MDLMSKLEQAVGNEHLINQHDFSLTINPNNKNQPNMTHIVSINSKAQPDSNKIVSVKSIDA